MDPKVKKLLNNFFIKNYSSVYKSTPELKIWDNNYYYTVNKDSNIICLLPLNKLAY